MEMIESQITVLIGITPGSVTFKDLFILAGGIATWFPKMVVRLS